MNRHLNSWQYKIALQKRYFETGLGLMAYPKYIVALGSFGETLRGNTANGVYILIIFGIMLYFFGRWWVKKDMYQAEQEVSNQYNLFVKEMRFIVVEMQNILTDIKNNATSKTNV